MFCVYLGECDIDVCDLLLEWLEPGYCWFLVLIAIFFSMATIILIDIINGNKWYNIAVK